MKLSYEDRQKQASSRIRREEEFRDLFAAANYRQCGDKYMAKVLIAHSRQWRLAPVEESRCWIGLTAWSIHKARPQVMTMSHRR